MLETPPKGRRPHHTLAVSLKPRRASGFTIAFVVLSLLSTLGAWCVPVPLVLALTERMPDPTVDAMAEEASSNHEHRPLSACVITGAQMPGLGAAGSAPYRRGGRDKQWEGQDHQSRGAGASRARMVDLSYLGFAITLVKARTGMVASRSMAPPPLA
jgi:hypothetical protein